MSFLVRYPEFANVDKARIELAQQDAENQMSRKIWGKKFEQGRDALTAHLLYVSGALTKSGHSNGKPVQSATSKAAGGLSIGYSAPDAGFGSNHDGYASSTYGQEYIRLRKLVGVHVMVIP
ncbi:MULTISPECIES: DUF4054 domain-containing protein [unclassified Proteus (in: enterobacteria)]|uniref:DUF4054 domain-containing protein n=1 Tax=unclassified Proteus (in: enterobacteria) TaxID=257482 RepID=UPI001377C53C|nr:MULTISPECIES: DUF4054 domain-containing protein [unclassified Proteus (in: enterobacteria)]NBM87761.1 DUF4054 domain-containing protein [Proteus sp. G2661]NBM97339.1 DUF4054 domain-containing protein [Proteus sp. G2660]